MTAYKETTTIVDSTANINREFHKEEASTYWLPKDEEEQMRLTGQHYAFKSLFEGNVLPSVTDALDFQKGINILDVGCGSGVWIMDMVQEYPNCTYHGCDIVNILYKNVDVKQFTFSKGNIIKGLPYEDNTFDFVHMRFFVLALREDEWSTAIKELIRVTKPGGMIQISEFGFQLPKDTTNIFYRTMSAFRDTCKAKGQNVYIGAELENMLSKFDGINITQSECSGTNTAKLFIWDALETLAISQERDSYHISIKNMITQNVNIAAVDPTFFDTKQEFHNDETSGYWLPKGEEEQKRLTAQHFAIKSLYGRNVMSSVIETLDLEGGITILDVGCSSGAWIMDIVQEYPNCIYHGCDIVDVTYKNVDVKQFIFSLGNVTNRLPYEDNTFDFVHMRLFVACLRKNEWPAALSEVIRVTKPGGMIQLGEFDLQPQNGSSSLYYRILSYFKDACKSRGQNPDIGSELEMMLSKYSNRPWYLIIIGSGTSTAKMFIWDNLEVIKSMRSVLGPMLGIHNKKDLISFLKEYKHDLETKESVVGFAAVTVQKL
ncbi:hypothetical protein RMCBS344292_17879 [Rhizopus microsporus]|nr:hypothetical protein RMCBS344292_17879 [Rhizopus microsporus]